MKFAPTRYLFIHKDDILTYGGAPASIEYTPYYLQGTLTTALKNVPARCDLYLISKDEKLGFLRCYVGYGKLDDLQKPFDDYIYLDYPFGYEEFTNKLPKELEEYFDSLFIKD